MGRPSNRPQRRAEIVEAFARVLASHGYAGATIAAVAAEADISPGLVHHHFTDKADLLEALLTWLVDRFRLRTGQRDDAGDPLHAYVDAALTLDHRADTIAARCWVGVFAEAIRVPALFRRFRRVLDGELADIRKRDATLSSNDASAVLSFVLGCLVFGAFAPNKTSGFAAPSTRTLIRALRQESDNLG